MSCHSTVSLTGRPSKESHRNLRTLRGPGWPAPLETARPCYRPRPRLPARPPPPQPPPYLDPVRPGWRVQASAAGEFCKLNTIQAGNEKNAMACRNGGRLQLRSRRPCLRTGPAWSRTCRRAVRLARGQSSAPVGSAPEDTKPRSIMCVTACIKAEDLQSMSAAAATADFAQRVMPSASWACCIQEGAPARRCCRLRAWRRALWPQTTRRIGSHCSARSSRPGCTQ